MVSNALDHSTVGACPMVRGETLGVHCAGVRR